MAQASRPIGVGAVAHAPKAVTIWERIADSAQAAILPVHFLAEAGLTEVRDYQSVRFDLDVGKHGDTGTSELVSLGAVLDGRAHAAPVGDTTWAMLLVTKQLDVSRLRAV